ncbi:hypothetical protein EBR57_09770 [bacterium]|nr:hypothetical protein [bacterium]
MSRWLVITVSGIVIAAAITIVIMFYLIKKNEKAEQDADKLYLEQKADILSAALKTNLGSSDSTAGASALLDAANKTRAKVDSSTTALAGVVARQKSLLQTLKNKYAAEKARVLGQK